MALVKYNNNSLSAITSTASMPAGAMVLIKEQTASSSATISFVHGTSDVVLDSTYPIYVFKFINIHPATDDANLFMKARDGSTDYDATQTQTFFIAHQMENDGGAGMQYQTGSDYAQVTTGVRIAEGVGNENDQCESGELWLFNPSSTTFVKHFFSRFSRMYPGNDSMVDDFVGGYFNVTAAIDAIQFSMHSGNIDSGTIKLYGIKDS
jgi:hypothetical protein